jgi:hypothetical protein
VIDGRISWQYAAISRRFMPANWNTLVANIKARRCIPFLGAGACAGVLPSGEELAGHLLEGVDSVLPFPFPGTENNLAKVAQVVAAVTGDPGVLKRRVADAIQTKVGAPGKPAVPLPNVHTALARLRLPLYLTTNYDTLLEESLQAEGARHVSEVCRWNNDLLEDRESIFENSDSMDPTENQSIVFHLHGRVDVPESMVLTEDDYLDFLLNSAKDVAGKAEARLSRTVLPYPLRKLIKNRPLLFIGYSLSDINFLVILRGLLRSVEPSGRVQRVAVHLDPAQHAFPGANFQQIKERVEKYFSWTLAVEVFWGTADDLVAELSEALDPPAAVAP